MPYNPVYQYANTYGGPYFPPNKNYPNNYVIPQAWLQYMSQQIPYPYAPIQTEYEGYFVPVQPPASQKQQQMQQSMGTEDSNSNTPMKFSDAQMNADFENVIRALLPQNLAYFIVNWGTLALNLLSIVTFGGIITAAICTLTPICSAVSLPLGLRSDYISSTFNGSAITVERVRRAADFVNTALLKYEQLQKAVHRKSKSMDQY